MTLERSLRNLQIAVLSKLRAEECDVFDGDDSESRGLTGGRAGSGPVLDTSSNGATPCVHACGVTARRDGQQLLFRPWLAERTEVS